MFTGIIERTGKIVDIVRENSNYHFTIFSEFACELKIDQSLAHDGCCLTIVAVDYDNKTYVVTAMDETILKTNLKYWTIGYEVNLERSLLLNARFDGHIVQGHVDQIATCQQIIDDNGSWRFFFTYECKSDNFTVPKGSISVNGVSLTVVDSKPGVFSVAIIPYTYQFTNFHNFKLGTIVNIEFDILGKYISTLMEQYLKDKK